MVNHEIHAEMFILNLFLMLAVSCFIFSTKTPFIYAYIEQMIFYFRSAHHLSHHPICQSITKFAQFIKIVIYSVRNRHYCVNFHNKLYLFLIIYARDRVRFSTICIFFCFQSVKRKRFAK